MGPKEFHIWEFPEDKIRVLLKNQKQFLLNASKFIGSYKNLAKFIMISNERLRSWKKLYIPLWALKKLYELGLIKKLDTNKRSWEWGMTNKGKKILKYSNYRNKDSIINQLDWMVKKMNINILWR